jgi:hypothetical protein
MVRVKPRRQTLDDSDDSDGYEDGYDFAAYGIEDEAPPDPAAAGQDIAAADGHGLEGYYDHAADIAFQQQETLVHQHESPQHVQQQYVQQQQQQQQQQQEQEQEHAQQQQQAGFDMGLLSRMHSSSPEAPGGRAAAAAAAGGHDAPASRKRSRKQQRPQSTAADADDSDYEPPAPAAASTRKRTRRSGGVVYNERDNWSSDDFEELEDEPAGRLQLVHLWWELDVLLQVV